MATSYLYLGMTGVGTPTNLGSWNGSYYTTPEVSSRNNGNNTLLVTFPIDVYSALGVPASAISNIKFTFDVAQSATGAFTGVGDVVSGYINSGGSFQSVSGSHELGKGSSDLKYYCDTITPYFSGNTATLALYFINQVATKKTSFYVNNIIFEVNYTPHTHSYTPSVIKAATCTETGTRRYACSCGDYYDETIPATGHSYTSQTFDPTETEGGYTRYTCSVCGHSYDADFKYRINIVAENGTVTGATSGNIYGQGTSLTLTVTPKEGYKFTQWSDGNTDNPRTIKVTSNATYTAEFVATYYKVLYTSTTGLEVCTFRVISGSSVEGMFNTYVPGSVVEIKARPEDGYVFSHWEDGSTDNPRRVEVTNNIVVTPYFDIKPPEITSVTITRSSDLAKVTIDTPVDAGSKYIISVEVT